MALDPSSRLLQMCGQRCARLASIILILIYSGNFQLYFSLSTRHKLRLCFILYGVFLLVRIIITIASEKSKKNLKTIDTEVCVGLAKEFDCRAPVSSSFCSPLSTVTSCRRIAIWPTHCLRCSRLVAILQLRLLFCTFRIFSWWKNHYLVTFSNSWPRIVILKCVPCSSSNSPFTRTHFSPTPYAPPCTSFR